MTNRRLIINIQRRGGLNRDALVEAFTRTIAGDMMSTRLTNTLRITVKLRAGTGKGSPLGFCQWRDYRKGGTARSKHHTIVVQRDLPINKLLSVIVHELQHVEQMVTGRLKLRARAGRMVYLWRAKGQRGKAELWETNSCYCSRPWEVEARAAQEKYRGVSRDAHWQVVSESLAAA